MDNVKRYTVTADIAYPIHEDPEGSYVHWDDYAAILAEVGRLHMHAQRRDEYAIEKAAETLAAVKELRAVWDAIPAGLLYLDPPDGGDVPLAEQVRRMGEDASRYNWIRRTDTPILHALQWANGAVLDHAVDVARCAMPDAAIDSAMADTARGEGGV